MDLCSLRVMLHSFQTHCKILLEEIHSAKEKGINSQQSFVKYANKICDELWSYYNKEILLNIDKKINEIKSLCLSEEEKSSKIMELKTLEVRADQAMLCVLCCVFSM